jgi:hypothetical protein
VQWQRLLPVHWNLLPFLGSTAGLYFPPFLLGSCLHVTGFSLRKWEQRENVCCIQSGLFITSHLHFSVLFLLYPGDARDSKILWYEKARQGESRLLNDCMKKGFPTNLTTNKKLISITWICWHLGNCLLLQPIFPFLKYSFLACTSDCLGWNSWNKAYASLILRVPQRNSDVFSF